MLKWLKSKLRQRKEAKVKRIAKMVADSYFDIIEEALKDDNPRTRNYNTWAESQTGHLHEPMWFVHHDRGVPIEVLDEPIENRVKWIKNTKPEHEIETRLRALKPIHVQLPKEVADRVQDLIDALKEYQAARILVDNWPHWRVGPITEEAFKRISDAEHAVYKADDRLRDAQVAHMDELKALMPMGIDWTPERGLKFPNPT